MTLFLVIVHVIVCFVLIAVILLQAGRGHGLTGGGFSSGNVQSLFGTGAADFMTKATLVSAVCFIVTCLSLDFIEAQKSRSLLQAERPGAPIDLDQIKKALEKVKSEAEAGKATAEDAAGELAGVTPAEVIPAEDQAEGAVEAAKTVETVLPEAPPESSTVPAAAPVEGEAPSGPGG